jgi:hypothetical protein
MKYQTAWKLALAVVVLVLSGCAPHTSSSYFLTGGGTSGGNPASATLQFAPFMGGQSNGDNEATDLSMCITTVAFVPADNSSPAVSIQLATVVSPDAGGTPIEAVNIPQGLYKKIVFGLADGCQTGYSMTFVNSSGTTVNVITPLRLVFLLDTADPTGHTDSLDLSSLLGPLGSATGPDTAATDIAAFIGTVILN